MTHVNEISQFNDETQVSCVCFVSHGQISSIMVVKCHYCQILCRGSLQTTESVQIWLKNYFSCSDPLCVSMWTKKNINLMIFDVVPIYRCLITIQDFFIFRTEFWIIFWKSVPRLSLTPSRRCIIIGVTCRMNFSTHSECMNKPWWDSINREKI